MGQGGSEAQALRVYYLYDTRGGMPRQAGPLFVAMIPDGADQRHVAGIAGHPLAFRALAGGDHLADPLPKRPRFEPVGGPGVVGAAARCLQLTCFGGDGVRIDPSPIYPQALLRRGRRGLRGLAVARGRGAKREEYQQKVHWETISEQWLSRKPNTLI